MFVSGCYAAGFAPDIVQTAPDSWTCVALVAAGVGLHFATDSAVRQMALDGVRIVPAGGGDPAGLQLSPVADR